MVRSAPADCFLAAIEIFLMAILSFLQLYQTGSDFK